MPATLHRFRSRPQRLRQAQAEQLRQLVLDVPGLPDAAVGAIVATIDRETAAENEWTFVMLSPAQNEAVVDWLDAHSVRPRKAVRLWAKLFGHLRRDTGEIMLTRAEMAGLIGEEPRSVSTIMSELERIGAIIRRREGRVTRYYMSPLVGTHLAGGARDRAQAEAPALRVVE